MTDFLLELAAGQSRSGKTWLTAKRVEKERNLLVWDTMGEWAASFRCKRITSAHELRRIAANGVTGRYAFDVQVTPQNFDLFCRCAWLWIRILHARRRYVALVVEELADVSPPGKAPAAWGDIVRKSMRFNPHIYALTQSPAESDKTVMRNATVLRCHAMARVADRKTMAGELDVDQATLDALDFSRFAYVERDRRTRHLVTAAKGRRPKTL